MRPPNRNHRQSRSVWNTSRTQSLFRSEIGLDASRHIYLPSEGKGEEFFLDIPSHRAHRAGWRAIQIPVVSSPIRTEPRFLGITSGSAVTRPELWIAASREHFNMLK